MKRIVSVSIPIFILCIFALISLSSMRYNSGVYDEVSHHIGSGYSFLKTRDFRLNSTQPPLVEELAAIPLLFLKPALPIDHPSWVNIDRATFNFQFLYRYNKDADKILFWSRFVIVLLSILCGLLVFAWTKGLYGYRAGILALSLYAFSPNIIAYSQIVTADLGATFFMLLATYCFYKFLAEPKIEKAVFAGITLGLAEASKLTALILMPLYLAIALWQWQKTKRVRFIIGLLFIYIICYLVVFACYFGEVKPLLKNDIDVPEKIGYIEKTADKIFRGNEAVKNSLVNFALNVPIPFSTYLMNILSSTNMILRQNIFDVYLFGEHSTTGWWYYYLVVFLFKTPIPTFLLLVVTPLFFNRPKPKERLSETLLVCFIIVFSATCLLSKLQGGVRYILPLYPFLFIYISKIASLKIDKKIYINAVIPLLIFWYIAEAVMIYPHYIAYFNQFAGGPQNGWRYLRSSNIDYGQDLPALASYMKQNNIDEVKLSYCGTADPAYYGIRYKDFSKEDFINPNPAVYAVSVSYIDSLKWVKDIEPTEKAGHSIFIYDLRTKE